MRIHCFPAAVVRSAARIDSRAVAIWAVSLIACAPALAEQSHQPAVSAALPPFSTILQGNSTIQGLGRDGAGNIYVLGQVVGDSPIPAHGTDFFMAKLDPGATRYAYFVYLGGSGDDFGAALAVDAAGNAYITGTTASADFPGAPNPAADGTPVPFVMKLSPTGAIVYANLFAGQLSATPQAIAVDSAGNAVVSGIATASGYPVTSGAFTVGDSQGKPFVTKVDATGGKLLFSAVGVGGSQIEGIIAYLFSGSFYGPRSQMTFGPQGDIFLAGNTSNTAYPTTPGAFQTTFAPSQYVALASASRLFPTIYVSPEQYVTRLSADGSKLVYSTFLTGNSGAENEDLVVDSSGNAYVTGETNSSDYPYSAADATGARPGLFLTKLDAQGANVVWSVQQGGNLLAQDPSGNLVVSGSFPGFTTGIFYQLQQAPPSPPTDAVPPQCLTSYSALRQGAYAQRFDSSNGALLGTEILSATFVTPSAIAVTLDGKALLAGHSGMPDVPLTPGVVFSDAVAQRTVPGSFLAEFDFGSASLGGQLACAADAFTKMPVGPVAPGQIISLFGNGFGPATGVANSISGPGSVPTSLGGVTVTFDGVGAPLLYVSASQINLSVPFEVGQKPPPGASTVMKISVNGSVVASRLFAVTQSNPGLFVNGTQAVAFNSDGSLNSSTNPAHSGSSVTLLLNGANAALGPVPATGSITPANPFPTGAAVEVRADTFSLSSGPLVQWPGAIAGIYQLPVQVPSLNSSDVLPLGLYVSIGGVPAGPFSYYAIAQQTGVLVWWTH